MSGDLSAGKAREGGNLQQSRWSLKLLPFQLILAVLDLPYPYSKSFCLEKILLI